MPPESPGAAARLDEIVSLPEAEARSFLAEEARKPPSALDQGFWIVAVTTLAHDRARWCLECLANERRAPQDDDFWVTLLGALEEKRASWCIEVLSRERTTEADESFWMGLVHCLQGTQAEQTFKALARLLMPWMRRLASLRLGSVPEPLADPDDIVACALERMWRARKRWKPGPSVRAWAGTITVRLCASAHRKASAVCRNAARTLSGGDLLLDGLVSSLEAPGEALEITETAERFLRGLPAEQRLLLELVRQGASQAEAARFLGLTEATVSRRLGEIRAAVRDQPG